MKLRAVIGVLAIAVVVLSVGFIINNKLEHTKYNEQSKRITRLSDKLSLAKNEIERLKMNNSEAVFNKRMINAIENYQRIQNSKRLDRFNLAALDSDFPNGNADRNKIYGKLDSRFVLIEFTDFECPFCRKFHNVAQQLVDESEGNIQWQFKHFPLAFHEPAASKLGEAAECVAEMGGNRAFWAYTDLIYKTSPSNGAGIGLSKMLDMGQMLNINKQDLNECIASRRYKNIVIQDRKMGQEAGINSTPSMIIFDRQTRQTQLIRGLQKKSELLRVINHMKKVAAEKRDEH